MESHAETHAILLEKSNNDNLFCHGVWQTTTFPPWTCSARFSCVEVSDVAEAIEAIVCRENEVSNKCWIKDGDYCGNPEIQTNLNVFLFIGTIGANVGFCMFLLILHMGHYEEDTRMR